MSGRKYIPLTPAQQGQMVGFGQVPSLNRTQTINTDSWAAQEDGQLTTAQLKTRTTDAWTTMSTSYAAGDRSVPSSMAGLNARDPRTNTYRTYLASGVRGTQVNAAQRPTNGPLFPMHATLDAAVGPGKGHRLDFSCSEMHAVNRMLWDTNPGNNAGVIIEGVMVVKGTPDRVDRGSAGGKATMVPCSSTGPNVLGCMDVLKNLGITSDYI
ncbi:hypothetical protein N431DRAFT_425623 [Stipitochalara longipes BDJ]|nr:hypothetical protein N431DRAFT_425623 [Stipitochalara longipes BDJ]